MSDRQTPESLLHAMTDPHASIVQADGTVRPADTRPIPAWLSHAGGAARGAEEYRADQHAGVANSVQAAQGCRVAAGVSDDADLCPLGTADVVAAALDWLEGPEPPALPHANVFLHHPLFLRMMQLHGVDPALLPQESGQRYWDWVGGGIRYWDGWRKMPHG